MQKRAQRVGQGCRAWDFLEESTADSLRSDCESPLIAVPPEGPPLGLACRRARSGCLRHETVLRRCTRDRHLTVSKPDITSHLLRPRADVRGTHRGTRQQGGPCPCGHERNAADDYSAISNRSLGAKNVRSPLNRGGGCRGSRLLLVGGHGIQQLTRILSCSQAQRRTCPHDQERACDRRARRGFVRRCPALNRAAEIPRRTCRRCCMPVGPRRGRVT